MAALFDDKNANVSGSTNGNGRQREKKEIIVLGAGVVGLTTALLLLQEGKEKYKVTIVADIIPSDPKSVKYTSQWAGGHHVYNAIDLVKDKDKRQFEWERKTFKKMWDLSEPGNRAEEGFLRLPQTEYFFEERWGDDVPLKEREDPFEGMPDFEHLPKSSLIPGALSGVSFTTLTIEPPIYLNYLLTEFLSLGGQILRGSVLHINQVIEGGTSLFPGGGQPKSLYPPGNGNSEEDGDRVEGDDTPDAIIVCVGLGARTLGGVEDQDVFPARGQTVIVRTPWVRFGRTITRGVKDGAETYIIPRRSGDVILGGTRTPHDYFPRPRPSTTLDILTRAFSLCPELAPPEVRAVREPEVDDVRKLTVGVGCGLRPNRVGGARVEREWREIEVGAKGEGGKRKVAVVHNYGHGGYGYQTSWGCAEKVVELVNGALFPDS